MFSRNWLALGVGLVTLVSLTGCSKKDGTFATVSGVVTLNGAPVEGARVLFHSTVEVEGKQGATYGAQTDSSGKYVIATVGKDPGIPPGLYKVTVVKLEGKGAMAAGEGMDAGQLDAAASDMGSSAKGGPINLLPKEYSNPTTTKLSATLEQGKNEGKDFSLKGK